MPVPTPNCWVPRAARWLPGSCQLGSAFFGVSWHSSTLLVHDPWATAKRYGLSLLPAMAFRGCRVRAHPRQAVAAHPGRHLDVGALHGGRLQRVHQQIWGAHRSKCWDWAVAGRGAAHSTGSRGGLAQGHFHIRQAGKQGTQHMRKASVDIHILPGLMSHESCDVPCVLSYTYLLLHLCVRPCAGQGARQLGASRVGAARSAAL